MDKIVSGLYGQFQTTLDEKGRFALPARLRNVLDPRKEKPLLAGELVITKGLEGCLAIYPEPEWQSIQDRLATVPFTQRDLRYFSRRFYSLAGLVIPDRNGRINVPTHLIAEAGLKKDLLVVGVNRWIEVWNPERFQYYLEQFSGSYEETAERLFSGNESSSE